MKKNNDCDDDGNDDDDDGGGDGDVDDEQEEEEEDEEHKEEDDNTIDEQNDGKGKGQSVVTWVQVTWAPQLFLRPSQPSPSITARPRYRHRAATSSGFHNRGSRLRLGRPLSMSGDASPWRWASTRACRRWVSAWKEGLTSCSGTSQPPAEVRRTTTTRPSRAGRKGA